MSEVCSPAHVNSGRETHEWTGRWTAPAGRPFQTAEVLVRCRQCEGKLSRNPADSPPGPASVVVTIGEILKVGRMYSPEMALTVVTATSFDEALVQRKVVSDTVSPVLFLFEKVFMFNIQTSTYENECERYK